MLLRSLIEYSRSTAETERDIFFRIMYGRRRLLPKGKTIHNDNDTRSLLLTYVFSSSQDPSKFWMGNDFCNTKFPHFPILQGSIGGIRIRLSHPLIFTACLKRLDSYIRLHLITIAYLLRNDRHALCAWNLCSYPYEIRKRWSLAYNAWWCEACTKECSHSTVMFVGVCFWFICLK